MNRSAPFHAQRGATLIVGLIMLVLITLMVTSAFTLSTTNLKSVGNMQIRNEAIAAANAAIETALADDLASTDTSVTIGNVDYAVELVVTPCTRASIAAAGALSSLSLPVTMSSTNDWNVISDIQATVDDPSSGAKVVVHQGVSALLSQAEKDAQCP